MIRIPICSCKEIIVRRKHEGEHLNSKEKEGFSSRSLKFTSPVANLNSRLLHSCTTPMQPFVQLRNTNAEI